MKKNNNPYQIKRDFSAENRKLIFSKKPYENPPLPFLNRKKSLGQNFFDMVLRKCKSAINYLYPGFDKRSEEEIVFEEEAKNIFEPLQNPPLNWTKPNARKGNEGVTEIKSTVNTNNEPQKGNKLASNLSFETDIQSKRTRPQAKGKNKYQLLMKKRKSGEVSYKIMPIKFFEGDSPLSPNTEKVDKKPRTKLAPNVPKKEFFLDLGEIKPKVYKVNFGLENLYSADTSESNHSEPFSQNSDVESANSAASIKKGRKQTALINNPIVTETGPADEKQVPVSLGANEKTETIISKEDDEKKELKDINTTGVVKENNEESVQDKGLDGEPKEQVMPQISLFGNRSAFQMPTAQNLFPSASTAPSLQAPENPTEISPVEQPKENNEPATFEKLDEKHEIPQSENTGNIVQIKHSEEQKKPEKSLFGDLTFGNRMGSSGLFSGLQTGPGLFSSLLNQSNQDQNQNIGNKLESHLFAPKKKLLADEFAERKEEERDQKLSQSSATDANNSAGGTPFPWTQNSNSLGNKEETVNKCSEKEPEINTSSKTSSFFQSNNAPPSLLSLVSSANSKTNSFIKNDISDFDKEPKFEDSFPMKQDNISIFNNNNNNQSSGMECLFTQKSNSSIFGNLGTQNSAMTPQMNSGGLFSNIGLPNVPPSNIFPSLSSMPLQQQGGLFGSLSGSNSFGSNSFGYQSSNPLFPYDSGKAFSMPVVAPAFSQQTITFPPAQTQVSNSFDSNNIFLSKQNSSELFFAVSNNNSNTANAKKKSGKNQMRINN